MKALWLILLLLMAEVILFLFFIPPERMESIINNEMVLYENTLGESTANDIRVKADQWFQSTAIDTGVRQATWDFMIGFWQSDENLEHQLNDRGLGKWTIRQMQTFWGVYYMFLHRVASTWIWVPAWFMLLVVATIDAMAKRKADVWKVSMGSTMVHATSTWTIGATVGSMIIFVFMPFSTYPWIIPILSIILLYFIWLVMVNYTKAIG